MVRRHADDAQNKRETSLYVSKRVVILYAQSTFSTAHNAMMLAEASAFIETMMDKEEDDDDFRPY